MKILHLCLALSLFLSAKAFSQEYDVVFHRPIKTGDSFTGRVKFTVDDDQQMVVNGAASPASKKVKLDLDLIAKVEILAVDKSGRATEDKQTVQSCECRESGKVVSLFGAGDIIVMKEGKPKEYSVNGVPASGLAATVLQEVFPSGTDEHSSDDLIFSPGKKVKVGDTWPINLEPAVADLSKKMSTEFPKDSLKGSVMLQGIGSKDGSPFLQLSASMQLNAPGLAMPGMPPGIATKKFEGNFKFGVDLPVDPKKQALRGSMEMQAIVEGGGTLNSNGQSIDVSFHLVKNQKREATIISWP